MFVSDEQLPESEVKRLMCLTGEPLAAELAKPGGLERYTAAQAIVDRAGEVDGIHYTNHVKRVKELESVDDKTAAIELLLRLVEAVEAESRLSGPYHQVAPYYYERLAINYRYLGQLSDEEAILRRYIDQHKLKSCQPIESLVKRLDVVSVKRGMNL